MSASPLFLQQSRRRIAQAFGPPILFLLLSAAFLWQPILSGKVFLPTDLAYSYDFIWKVQAEKVGIQTAQNPLLSDVALYYYPYADYAIKRLSHGEFPLWNPYILTGTPFFATTQAAVLDPINLLTFTAGPFAYWTWAALLRLTMLGLTTFGFARALGRSMSAGMAAGAVFMACGFVAVWLNYSVVTTLAWLPALFWATTRLIQTGRMVWVAGTALCIGGLLLGGHPETQFLIGLMWGLYSLYSLFIARKQRPNIEHPARRLAPLAGAVVLGVAISAVQTFTFLDLLLSSNAISQRNTPVAPFDLGQSALRLVVLFFPNFSGTPLRGNYWPGEWTNFNEQSGYFGLLALALATLGTVYWWRRDRIVPFFAGGIVLAVLLAIRAPGFHLVRALPIFNVGHGVRWIIILSFFGAVLTAYGIDALFAIRPRTNGARNIALALSVAALSALGFLLVQYIGIRAANWDQAWHPQITHVKMAFLFSPLRMTMYWPVAFLAAGAVVLLAWWRGLFPRAAMITLLALLMYADLWTFGSQYNPVTPKNAIYPKTGAIKYLEKNLGHDRFVGALGMAWPNTSMLFGLRDVRGYEDVVDQNYFSLYGTFRYILMAAKSKDLELTPAQNRALQVGSVDYLLTPRKPRVGRDPSQYKGVFQEQSEKARVAIYQNAGALPRAYIVFNTEITADMQTATNRVLDPKYDPHRSVVLTGQAEPLKGPALSAGAVPVTWLKDEPEEIVLKATLPTAGYLVLTDNYASGWEATIDNNPSPIIRANVVYRGVFIPPGTHTVRFRYRPPLFYAGAIISAVGIATVLMLAVLQLVRSARNRVNASK